MATKLTYAERMRADGKYPAVLRFESIHPTDVAGIIGHAERRIGDLSHIDFSRTHLNEILVGDNDIASKLRVEAAALAELNHKSNLLGLSRAGRKKDLARAREAGPQDPWSEQKKGRGPLRELVLTLHRDFFRAAEDCPRDERLEFIDDDGKPACFDMRRCREFVSAGQAFLVEEFGDDLVYLRADYDEQSIHLQGVVRGLVREPPSVRYAHGRMLLRTSQHRIIGGDGKKKGYELAQDAAGEFFARPEFQHMNIVRAEPRAALRRDVVQELEQARAELDAVCLSEEAAVPAGSANAQAMWLLRKKMEEAIAEKGAAEKVRKDVAAGLALDYLEALGVLAPEQRREASTRRARTELLSRFEEKFGTAAEILADPEAVSAKVVDEAKAKIASQEASSRERLEAVAAEKMRDNRAVEYRAAKERLAAQKAADEARQAAAEVERRKAESLRVWREAKVREEAAGARAAELDRRDEELTRRRAEVEARAAETAEREGRLKEVVEVLRALARPLLDAVRTLQLDRVPSMRDGILAAERLLGLKHSTTGGGRYAGFEDERVRG